MDVGSCKVHKTPLKHLRDGRWKLQPTNILLTLYSKALTSSRFLENLHHMFFKLQSVDFNQAAVSIKAAKPSKDWQQTR